MGNLILAIVYVFFAIGFLALGIYGLRHPKALTRFFNERGSMLYGKKIADKIYTEAGLRVATVGFVIIGPIFIVIGVIRAVNYAVELFA